MGGGIVNGRAGFCAVLLLSFLLPFGCAGDRSADTPAPDEELARLAAWLSGSFSSAAQAERDVSYFDIRIHAVRIWNDRADGAWIYLEQAAADSLDRPYRQRVYHVTRLGADLFESRVFALEEPLQYAGRWREETPLTELAPGDLLPREGCAVLLRAIDADSFSGSTLGRLCTSSLRGASYATSEVVVQAGGLTSWDRGYDADGAQVWGAEDGPYAFERIEEPAAE